MNDSASKISPSWKESSLPFFVVVQDESTYVSSGIAQSADSDSKESLGTFDSNSLYPEVRYIFSDDYFSTSTEALEQSKDDISVIVDIDSSGERIESCDSLSATWQVTGATITATNSQAWMGEDALNSFKIIVKGTGSSISSNSQTTYLEDSDSSLVAVEKIKQAVQMFRDRNEQLKALLNSEQ